VSWEIKTNHNLGDNFRFKVWIYSDGTQEIISWDTQELWLTDPEWLDERKYLRKTIDFRHYWHYSRRLELAKEITRRATAEDNSRLYPDRQKPASFRSGSRRSGQK
jgi:hypothetical protein